MDALPMAQTSIEAGDVPPSSQQAAATVLVLLDAPALTDAEVPATVLELLTAARGLGRVDVVTLTAPSVAVLATLGQYGVRAVYQVALPAGISDDAKRLTPVVAAVLETAANRVHADLVLVPNSFVAKEAGAVAAARLNAGFINNALTIAPVVAAGLSVVEAAPCAGLETTLSISADSVSVVVASSVDGQRGQRPTAATTTSPAKSPKGFTVTCRVFGGTWDVTAQVLTDPAVISVAPGGIAATPVEQATVPEVYPLPVAVSPPPITVVSREAIVKQSGRPDLASAREVVAAGRGCNGDLTPVFELADALGAAVGATRDVAFDGLFDTYIGATGLTVAPELYVACGISGAPYHTGGMRGSKYIVSVNNDEDAPINPICDLVIVGDVAEVLPQATTLIRNRHSG